MAKKTRKGVIYPKILTKKTKQICPTCGIGFSDLAEVFAVRLKGVETYWHIECLVIEVKEALDLANIGKKIKTEPITPEVKEGQDTQEEAVLEDDYPEPSSSEPKYCDCETDIDSDEC